MAEYIKRESALKVLASGSGCGNICSRAIKNIPAADVVEVVRCEKCQKFDPDEIAAPNTGTCWHHEMIKRFDDFCSYGERRSE